MQYNAVFAKGKTHLKCEDYALAGTIKNVPMIIVCDGCSSSPNTDVGARLLAHSLINICRGSTVDSTIDSQLSLLDENIEELILVSALQSARNLLNPLALSNSCLDVTCLFSYVFEGKVFIHTIGDGAVYVKWNNGEERIWLHEFESGAPLYGNYLLDLERKAEYHKTYPGVRKISEGSFENPNEVITTWPQVHSLVFPEEEISLVALMSDGCSTVKNVPTYSAIEAFTSFKNTQGAFVERRLRKALLEYNNDHDDDISVAALSLDDLCQK